MQVYPGDAFLQTVSGSAGRPAPAQPAPDSQPRAPAHAVKAAGRSHEAVDGARREAEGRPAAAQPARVARSAAPPANAPRGSFVNLLV